MPLLTGEKRTGGVECVVDEVGGEVPVIIGVGAPSTYEPVAQAERAGIEGVVSVTPCYYPIDHDAALTHYRRVAESVSVPVYITHIPSKTGNALSLELV